MNTPASRRADQIGETNNPKAEGLRNDISGIHSTEDLNLSADEIAKTVEDTNLDFSNWGNFIHIAPPVEKTGEVKAETPKERDYSGFLAGLNSMGESFAGLPDAIADSERIAKRNSDAAEIGKANTLLAHNFDPAKAIEEAKRAQDAEKARIAEEEKVISEKDLLTAAQPDITCKTTLKTNVCADSIGSAEKGQDEASQVAELDKEIAQLDPTEKEQADADFKKLKDFVHERKNASDMRVRPVNINAPGRWKQFSNGIKSIGGSIADLFRSDEKIRARNAYANQVNFERDEKDKARQLLADQILSASDKYDAIIDYINQDFGLEAEGKSFRVDVKDSKKVDAFFDKCLKQKDNVKFQIVAEINEMRIARYVKEYNDKLAEIEAQTKTEEFARERLYYAAELGKDKASKIDAAQQKSIAWRNKSIETGDGGLVRFNDFGTATIVSAAILEAEKARQARLESEKYKKRNGVLTALLAAAAILGTALYLRKDTADNESAGGASSAQSAKAKNAEDKGASPVPTASASASSDTTKEAPVAVETSPDKTPSVKNAYSTGKSASKAKTVIGKGVLEKPPIEVKKKQVVEVNPMDKVLDEKERGEQLAFAKEKIKTYEVAIAEISEPFTINVDNSIDLGSVSKDAPGGQPLKSNVVVKQYAADFSALTSLMTDIKAKSNGLRTMNDVAQFRALISKADGMVGQFQTARNHIDTPKSLNAEATAGMKIHSALIHLEKVKKMAGGKSKLKVAVHTPGVSGNTDFTEVDLNEIEVSLEAIHKEWKTSGFRSEKRVEWLRDAGAHYEQILTFAEWYLVKAPAKVTFVSQAKDTAFDPNNI